MARFCISRSTKSHNDFQNLNATSAYDLIMISRFLQAPHATCYKLPEQNRTKQNRRWETMSVLKGDEVVSIARPIREQGRGMWWCRASVSIHISVSMLRCVASGSLGDSSVTKWKEVDWVVSRSVRLLFEKILPQPVVVEGQQNPGTGCKVQHKMENATRPLLLCNADRATIHLHYINRYVILQTAAGHWEDIW